MAPEEWFPLGTIHWPRATRVSARAKLMVIDGGIGAGDSAVGAGGETSSGQPAVADRDTRSDPLPPPESLPPEMVGDWHQIVADLRERKLWHETMVGAVEQYLVARWGIRQARQAIATHGALIVGADGLMRGNPALGLLRTSQDAAARLAEALGLTPASRSRKALKPAPGQGDLFPGDEWDL